MTDRLQKLLASEGLGSRREIEGWISEGRITVNGKVASLGDKASAEDRIKIDGKPVRVSSSRPLRLIAYHKPVGEVTTRHDPQGRPTVFDSLPKLRGSKWVSIGRLDINTSGLLLFTTDGNLANALMHPSRQVEREYAVRLRGEVTPAMLKAMTEGVELEDGKARFEEIVEGGGSDSNLWFYVVIMEGRKREVRRLWESQGVTVSRLVRTRYGNVILKRSLPRGRFRDLDDDEMQGLYSLAGLERPQKTRRQSSQRARKVNTRRKARAAR